MAVRSPGVHGGGPWWQLHHRTCWQARGGWCRLVTTAEARRILATLSPDRLCDICRPDQRTS
nr:DUF6233 domain-containing protein [Streptomyces albus]